MFFEISERIYKLNQKNYKTLISKGKVEYNFKSCC